MPDKKARIFLDTNILVYSWMGQDAAKQRKAREILRSVNHENHTVVSTQVLQEFYNVVTVKMGADKLAAKQAVLGFANMELVAPDAKMLQDAIDLNILNRISFWDAMIVAAALSANCSILYSEDLNPGQSFRGLKVHNPFMA